jgi:hypothetical protein
MPPAGLVPTLRLNALPATTQGFPYAETADDEVELAERWNPSPKTLQRWRSEGRGPRFTKMSRRVVYPMDEVLDFESEALRASIWESTSDVVRPNGSRLMDPREIALASGLPLHVFSDEQTLDSLGVPYRRVHWLIRFDRNEVTA